jgi:cyclopropane-fatty-acyl-phospholipid synthase
LRLIQGDFAEVSVSELGKERFDLVLGIGLFEHIHNLGAALERIAALLRPGGRLFLHLIVSKPVVPRFLDARSTLIGSYFPGGRIWPFSALEGRAGALVTERSWFINGLNYWRTLDEWHRRFWCRMDALYGAVLSLDRVRYWNDYFSLCKACFRPADGDLFGNGHYLLRKASGL